MLGRKKKKKKLLMPLEKKLSDSSWVFLLIWTLLVNLGLIITLCGPV